MMGGGHGMFSPKLGLGMSSSFFVHSASLIS